MEKTSSLYRRLFACFFCLIAALTIVQISTLLWTFSRVAEESEQRAMRNVACQLRALFEPHLAERPDYSSLALVAEASYAANPKLKIFFLNGEGRIVGAFGSSHRTDRPVFVPLESVKALLQEGVDAHLPLYGTDPENPKQDAIFSACQITIAGEPSYLYVILRTRFARSVYEMTVHNVVVVVAVAVLLVSIALAAFLGAQLVGYLRRRLERLSGVVQQFSRNNFTSRISTETNDEIGQLASAINGMADALENNIGQLEHRDALRRELIADVSHDLRGPVAGIKGYIGLLEMMPPERLKERSGDMFAGLARSCDSLEHLLHELFELAKLEAKSKEPELEPLDFRQLCNDCYLRCLGLAEKSGVRMTTVLPPAEVYVEADSGMLVRAIANLIGNAINYTPAGGLVELRLLEENGVATVEIADQGVGIAEEELSQVFGRFIKGSNSVKSASGSSGLGLAIVQTILERHKSSVQVTSEPGKGSKFSFSLPISGTRLSDHEDSVEHRT